MPATINIQTAKAIHTSGATRWQVNAALNLLNRFIENNHYQPMEFTATIELHDTFASFVVDGNRTDCDEFSPRNAFTRIHAHFFLGKRGKTTLVSYDEGCTTRTRKELRTIANIYRSKLN